MPNANTQLHYIRQLEAEVRVKTGLLRRVATENVVIKHPFIRSVDAYAIKRELVMQIQDCVERRSLVESQPPL